MLDASDGEHDERAYEARYRPQGRFHEYARQGRCYCWIYLLGTGEEEEEEEEEEENDDNDDEEEEGFRRRRS